eukprot:COSAG04_NODE_1062_length_8500_cov_11.838353_2_plen_289_part_00
MQAYGVVVLWKVVCAARLALDPESLSRLLALFFTHHIYVWCRAFVVLLETIGIFEETTYTVGIIFAGFVMMPFALGPGGNLMGMGVISLYCLVILPYKTDPELLKIERRQNMFLNSKWRKHVETLQSEMHDDDKGMRALAGAQNVCSLGHANADWAEVKSSTIVVEAPASVLPSTAAASNVAATRSGAVVKAVKVKPGQIIEPGAALVEITDTRKRQHHQVIPPAPSLFTRFRPYLAHFSPVFPRFLRVFTAWPRRFQRAASRNPGPRNGRQGAQEGRTPPFVRRPRC